MSDPATPGQGDGSSLLSEPSRLRRRIDALAAKKDAGNLSGPELEALAEAYFRLGVHPATPSDQALGLLRRAAACGVGDPKFSYHLARLCFQRGDLDRAAAWLRRAITASPTSHRLWAHASLLQQELNAHHRGDERYEPDGLRQRSIAVMERIRAGHDWIDPALLDFQPPPRRPPADGPAPDAPAPSGDSGDDGDGVTRRLNGRGRCRWSGVEDVLAEELLTVPASEQTRDRLLPLLDHASRRRSTTEGGEAAFAVLAVAWLVSGYPVATIRRVLGPPGEAGTSPSRELVEAVCELYEAGEAAVPELLTKALRADRVPPFVAAVLHQQRLLWYPLTFPRFAWAHRSARAFLDTDPSDDAQAEELTKALRRAAAEIEPSRPNPVGDRPDETQDPAARARLLAEEVEGLVGALQRSLPELWRQEREASRLGQAEEPHTALRAAIEGIETRCSAGLATLSAVRDEGADEASAEDQQQLEQFEQTFQQVTGQLGVARRLLRKLESRTRGTTSEQAGSEQSTGVELLRQTVEQVERQVAELFAGAEGTLDAYPPDLRTRSPLRALRAHVRAREAETSYRLGKHDRARALWSQVVREDRLEPAAMKNIAVVRTLGGDHVHRLEAWRSYCELLYQRAILAGTPRVDAGARIAFHRHFGAAYAPASLAVCSSTEQPPEQDDAAKAAFVRSQLRVALFVRHKLLECLNARLDFASPALLLGVARSDDDELRRKARDGLLTLLRHATRSLPVRVRREFATLGEHSIQAAYQDSSAAQRRTLAEDPWFTGELERYREWRRAVGDLKWRLHSLVRWQLQTKAVRGGRRVVNELLLLDLIPLGDSEELLRVIRRDTRGRHDPASVQGLFTQLWDEFGGDWMSSAARR
jgi:tetratricopeptide (TPR) repeat protein